MPSPRNILIFNHSYPIQFVDIANQYARLFNEQDRVTIVYLTGKPDEGVRQKTLADEVIFLDCPNNVTRGLKLGPILKMLKLQRDKLFDVVICHRYKPTYIMMWVALFYRIPVFISVMHELGTMRHLARKALIAALAPKNLIFAGVSNAVRDDMRRSLWRIPPGRVITLYNMIDIEFTEPQLYARQEARLRRHLSKDAFIFGTVGRLAKNKDQKTLIAAFALIKPRCPDAQLVILGDGQLEDELKQQVKELQLTADVHFSGYVADAFRYMKAFDVYVSSSIQEAFGRVLLEAMLARVPTIATRVHGMPEVLGDTGMLVNASDAKQLAAAMQKAYQLTPDVREQWGEVEYQRVAQEFSIPKFEEVMGQILLPGLDSNQ